jgi:3-oxoacyl-[acyl-carrier-protein] synthase II
MTERVVITGVGLVTPLGTGRRDVFDRLVAGDSGIRPLTVFDPSPLPVRLGAIARDFEPRDHINLRNLRKMDSLSAMATSAGRLAVIDAGVDIEEENAEQRGILLGVSFGSVDVSRNMARTIFTDGPRAANPLHVPNVVMNAPAGHMSIALGFQGINSTINHNAVSAETAIAFAASQITAGKAELILAGGVDGVSKFVHEILFRYKAISGSSGGEEGARPFDNAANGFIYGEAAGIVCLESLTMARQKKRHILAEVIGWGLASSPAPITDWPEEHEGLVLAIQRALHSSGLTTTDIDVVMAAANGSPKADRLEAKALTEVFGTSAERPLVTGIKGAMGESFTSGGVRTAMSAFALDSGIVPPTLGLKNPIADLEFVMGEARQVHPKTVMVTAVAAGGTYAALILKHIGG